MIGSHFSLILLPTNKCNVACEYCFEDKTNDFMSLNRTTRHSYTPMAIGEVTG